jgi:hypothetical protein
MRRIGPIILCSLIIAGQAAAQAPAAAPAAAPKPENDGLDPTKPVRTARIGLERLDFGSGTANWKLEPSINLPVGDGFTVLRAALPFAANTGFGRDAMAFSDASVKVTRVLDVTAARGIVLAAELVAPTAARADLGTGKWVFKPSAIYALFLKQGILAPSLVHSVSFAGDGARANVNITTLDLYFVPNLGKSKFLMTLDPALTRDWERRTNYFTLAVTAGVKLGPMLGGQGQFTIKPSVGMGGDRPYNWGMAANFLVVGF